MAGANLARPVMQSPDFSIAGRTGWAIFQNGTAYFFNVTAAGTVTATQFVGTNFEIAPSGAFFYVGAPALGNPPVLWIAAAGVAADPFGNSLPVAGGIVSEDSSNQRYTQINGSILLFDSANAGSFLVRQSQLALADALTATSNPLLQIDAPGAHAGAANGRILLAGGSNSAPYAQVIVTTTAFVGTGNTTKLLEVQGDIAILASPADTNARLETSGAELLFGSGSAAPDTKLYRAVAGTLAVSSIGWDNAGALETLHSVSLASPFFTAGFGAVKYKVVAENFQIFMDINLAIQGVSFGSGSAISSANLPAGYFNATNPKAIPCNLSAPTIGNVYCFVNISNAGALTYFGPNVTLTGSQQAFITGQATYATNT